MSKHDDPAINEKRSRVARLVNQARNRMVDTLDQALAPFGITAAQYVVIATLAQDKVDSAAQVCKELSYDPGAMTRMLDRLEHKNLIQRIHSKADRRTAKLVLTEQGEALFPQLLACYESLLAAFLGGFNPDELIQFELFLKRILA